MRSAVKCLVWDLDGTLWEGTLLESDRCRLRPGARDVLRTLDRRGILLSVASANDPEPALSLLRRRGLLPLFVQPRIGWGSKVQSVRAISKALGVSLDAMAFVDDEPYERERMKRMLPEVRVYAAADYRAIPALPEFHPGSLTDEARARRRTYQSAEVREGARRIAGLSQAEFLAQSGARLFLRPAVDSDLPRILELLQRTHQLNATGVIHGPNEVTAWLHDDSFRVFVAEMRDRYVDYGRIGVAACRREGEAWELVSFLLSCRVLSRGISGFVLAWVERQAALAGARVFRCRYRENDRNRRMAALYRLAGLKPEGKRADGIEIFSGPPPANARPPRWLEVREGAPA